MRRIVIVGTGTGGTLAANRLRKAFGLGEVTITCIDQDDRHVYQPGLLFVPFGLTHPEDIVRPRRRQLHEGISFINAAVDHVDIENQTVFLESGEGVMYDVLVIASGAVLALEETAGLSGPGWMDTVFTFYTPEGAGALEGALATFDQGHLVVNVIEMPIKCPVAPLEFCFLADWYFSERGVRDRVDLTFVTPLDAAFTQPIAARHFGGMLRERNIELATELNTGEVDASGGRLISYDEREVPFDLAVVIPAHNGAPYVTRSPGLGDVLGFVEADEHTLQAKAAAVGNPGMHMASLIGVLPGMSAIATRMMEKKMEAFDIPDIPEFMEMIADTGCGMFACKASVDLFGFTKEDFIPQVQEIITVGEFYAKAAGGEIIFT